MKFAICNETFHDRSLEAGFQLARECGYTGIEIAPFTIEKNAFDISPERRRAVRQAAADAGLEVVGLHWLLAQTEGYYLTSPDAAVRGRTVDYLCELSRLCRDLGGGLMVLGSPKQRNLLPGVSHARGIDYAAEVLAATAPALADCGVTLAVEPLGPVEGDFLNTADLAAELIARVASPQVRLHLDVKAMSTEPEPIPAIIRQHAALLAHFHANDPNLLGPGMGDVRYEPIFAALRDVGYDGWVSVEVFDYSPGPEKIARDSLAYMQDCLRRL